MPEDLFFVRMEGGLEMNGVAACRRTQRPDLAGGNGFDPWPLARFVVGTQVRVTVEGKGCLFEVQLRTGVWFERIVGLELSANEILILLDSD